MPHKTHTLMLIRHIYANHLNVVGKCCDFVQSICARNQSIWCSGVLLWSNSIHSHCGYFHSRFRMVFAQLIHNIVVIMIIIIIMRLFFKKNLNIIRLIHVCVHVLFLCMHHLWMDGWIFEPLHNLSMFIFSWRNKCYAYEIGLLDATFISHDFHFSRNRVERNIMGSGYPYQCIEQCHKSHKMNKTTMY